MPYQQPPRAVRSLRGLGTVTVVLLAGQVLLGLVAAVLCAWAVLGWSSLSGVALGTRLPADEAYRTLLLLRAPLTALTGIAFMSWLFVAASNARTAGALLRYGPGWAVGGWVVPVLSLWRPKQVMDDVWRASLPSVPPGVPLRLVQKPLVVTAWWAAFLVGGALPAFAVLGEVSAVLGPQLAVLTGSARTAVPPDMARVYESSALWNLWGAVLLVVAAGLAVLVVLRVTGWQEQRMRAAALP